MIRTIPLMFILNLYFSVSFRFGFDMPLLFILFYFYEEMKFSFNWHDRWKEEIEISKKKKKLQAKFTCPHMQIILLLFVRHMNFKCCKKYWTILHRQNTKLIALLVTYNLVHHAEQSSPLKVTTILLYANV